VISSPMNGPIHPTSVHWIGLGEMLESYHKLQPKPKHFPV